MGGLAVWMWCEKWQLDPILWSTLHLKRDPSASSCCSSCPLCVCVCVFTFSQRVCVCAVECWTRGTNPYVCERTWKEESLKFENKWCNDSDILHFQNLEAEQIVRYKGLLLTFSKFETAVNTVINCDFWIANSFCTRQLDDTMLATLGLARLERMASLLSCSLCSADQKFHTLSIWLFISCRRCIFDNNRADAAIFAIFLYL
jgi:hypothetical protein